MTVIEAREIVEAIRAQGVVAWVDQTGGGVATIIVGREDGSAYWDEGMHPVVLVGPGTFDWSDAFASKFYPGDLYVGPSNDQDDYREVTTAADAAAAALDYWHRIAR